MIISQMILLFGLMAVGYLAKITKIMDNISDRYFSKFITNIAIPATILSSAIGQNIENKMGAFKVLLVAVLVFVITPFVSILLVKILKLERTYELMLNYSNLGFMGIPIISSIYGTEYVFYVSIFMMVFNISLFSHGVSILQQENNSGKIQLKKLINPGIISALAALLIFIFEIPVPEFITSILRSVGTITTPLAMIVIGSTLASVKFNSIFTDKKIYIYTILKILVYPLLTWIVLHSFISDPVIIGVTVILCGLPTAGNISMLCADYNSNVELVTKGMFISTICSFVTIPLLMLIF